MRYMLTDTNFNSFKKRVDEAEERGHKVISVKHSEETFIEYDRVPDKFNQYTNQSFAVSRKYAALMEVNR